MTFLRRTPSARLSRPGGEIATPLAVSTAKRLKPVAEIPTLQEAGVPNVDMNLWWVTAAPAGTPAAIVDKLNGWFTDIGKMEETRTFLAKFGAEPFMGTPAETTAHINKEIQDWAEYVRLAKLPAQ